MLRKQSILTLSFILLSGASMLANAGLTTRNYTDEDSTVKVTSGKLKPCSSTLGVYTPKRAAPGAYGESSAGDKEIVFLCKTTTGNECTADIYNSANCSGSKVGYASLNLSTKKVNYAKSTDESKYIFSVDETGTVISIMYPSNK